MPRVRNPLPAPDAPGDLGEQVRRLIELYARLFFACHTRHVPDPRTGRRVSARQLQVLDHLDTEAAITMSGLARHMGVTPSTMSLAVDRLERSGYVRRVADRDDGRRVGVQLTEAGARIRDAHQVLDPELVRALLSNLSPRQRATALHGLALLAESAARGTGRTGPAGLERLDQPAETKGERS